MQNFNISFEETFNKEVAIDNAYKNRNTPFSNSPIYEVDIINFQLLTEGEDVKTVYQIDFDVKDFIFDIVPGDTIGILPQNDEVEVQKLLDKLNIAHLAQKAYCLTINDSNAKKKVAIPRHLPVNSTLYDVFLKHLDLRTVPKKLFLKSLIPFISDATEKETLESVINSSELYSQLIEKHRGLLSLLTEFTSCRPPVELILQHSSPLNPRYFSIASAPLDGRLSIIFNVIELEDGRKGICTGWLEKLIKAENWRCQKVPIYQRSPGKFRFIDDNVPNIYVAAGTGLAPFIGFLAYREQNQQQKLLPRAWLFYGCRYSERDFLHKDLLEKYLAKGILNRLDSAFSRSDVSKGYVQDRIWECRADIVDLVLNQNGVIFVCGNGQTVVKDVKEMLVKCFVDFKNVTLPIGEDILNELITNNKFIVDTWN